MKMFPWLALAVVLIIADQATKALATATLNYADPVPVIPLLNWTLLHNTGAAFSFLAEAGGWQRWFFTGVAAIVTVVLIGWLRQLKAGEWMPALGIALVIGGAIGNVIDRVALGYVVDFIDVYYDDWHWPAFNLADSWISIGVVLLLIDAFRGESGNSDS